MRDATPTPRQPRKYYLFTTISAISLLGITDRHRRLGGSRGSYSRLCAGSQSGWRCSRSSLKLAALSAHDKYAPFALAIGIGRAGERVAQQLHARTGWFPKISRVDVTREEDGNGAYNVVTTTGIPLVRQLPPSRCTYPPWHLLMIRFFPARRCARVLMALPAEVRAGTQAFCLRGVAESVAGIAALCPIAIGFAAPGRLLEEVSFINASGLVMRVGIRHANEPPRRFSNVPSGCMPGFQAMAMRS